MTVSFNIRTFFSFSDELPSLKTQSFLLENPVQLQPNHNSHTKLSQNIFDLEKKCDETSEANLNSRKHYSRVLNNFAEYFSLFDLYFMICLSLEILIFARSAFTYSSNQSYW